MKKMTMLIGLAMMLAVSCVASATTVGVVPGEWVKAIPADLAGGNTYNADGTAGGWYAGPDATWGGTGPVASKWYAHGSNGGISVSGTGGWNDLDHYCIYNYDTSSPAIKTVLSGLDPLGLYDIRVVYGVTSTGAGGVWAGLDSTPANWNWYQDVQGTDTGLWVPGRTGGDPAPSQYALLNSTPIQAVGGEIAVYLGAGNPIFYDGLTYDLVGQVPEPATLALLSLGMGVVLRKRSRK